MTKNIKTIDRIPYFQAEKINKEQLANLKLGVRPTKDLRIPKPAIIYLEKISENKGGH